MLFSVKPQHESAIGIHMYPSSWNSIPISLPIPPLQVDTEPLFGFPESYREFPLTIYFTHGNISIHVTLSIQLTLSYPLPKSINLFSVCFSIATLQIFQYHLSRFNIYVLVNDIYLSLSDLLHSVSQALGSCISLELTQMGSFLWLSNIPLHLCTMITLSIHLSVGI